MVRVVADLGGSSALARIEKAKKVMRDRKSGWSQVDELPVRRFLFLFLQALLITLVD
jgi:hypothetical protein